MHSLRLVLFAIGCTAILTSTSQAQIHPFNNPQNVAYLGTATGSTGVDASTAIDNMLSTGVPGTGAYTDDAHFLGFSPDEAPYQIDVDLGGSYNLTSLQAYVCAGGENLVPDTDRTISNVDFYIDQGSGFSSAGSVAVGDTDDLGAFDLAELVGSWSTVSKVRYEFTASSNTPPRVAEVLAISPDVNIEFPGGGTSYTFVPITGNTTSESDPWIASGNDAGDNLWFYTGAEDDTYLSYGGEDSPMFTTTVAGLDASHSYEISVVTMAGNQDWGVQACQAGGTLTSYGIMSVGAFNTDRLGNDPPNVDYYKIPVFQVNGVTEVSIDIDDLAGTNTRVWGVAYEDLDFVILPGDTNLDGKVDATDAANLAANWLETGANWAMGDFNDDGVVNDIDATILATNWQVEPTGGTASVPEPTCVVLLMGVALTGMQFFRKRNNI